MILIEIIILIIIIDVKTKTTPHTIANTKYIENTPYYKKKVIQYNIFKIMTLLLFITTFITTINMYKIAKDSLNNNKDINFCIDVSQSLDTSNTKTIENLEKIIKNSKNKNRFSITIFNTSAITLSPTTYDYKYNINSLRTLEKSLKLSRESNNTDLYLKNYAISGTLVNSKIKGTSLITDGIMSCTTNFSKNNKEKILIITTDNKKAGTSETKIKDIEKVAKEKNIKIYAITPKNIEENNKKELESLTKNTKGKLFIESSTISNNITKIINMKKDRQELIKINFIFLTISITLLLLNKKVLLW